ncbi:MAG: hydrolase TatD [Bacteroidales bacterium]|nr:hydrolase TatD [Bacteroidales bacterium]
MNIIDIHHHGVTAPENSVTSFSIGQPVPLGNGLLSVGIHPWHSESADIKQVTEELSGVIERNPRIVAIGETGIDRLRGAEIDKQLALFQVHIELSERLRKPLIIHSVRASDIILQQHKLYHPRQNWAIHGFRGKPVEALQLTGRGIYLSFGEQFNRESLEAIPMSLILAETDESSLPITQIIQNLSPVIDEKQIAGNTICYLSER